MRTWMFTIACLFVSLPCALGDDQTKPIGPAEAATKVNEQVTLEMEVKSATLRGMNCFLNSEKDFRDPKNLTLFIDKDALSKFKDAKIDDPAAHFKGKVVRVEGKVVLFRDRPEIKLSGPDVIKIVEKK
jgi:DNA/RNA endonuclease YhcR with UshA esterase domain